MKETVPAKRIGNVQEYYFSVKLKEIAQMNAQGADVINLGIGSPDLPPAREVTDTLAAEASDARAHGYQPYVGIPQLREAWANWYRRWYGVQFNPANEVLPLMGSKEGIMHISMAFVNEGDAVLVPNPGYPTYTSVSKLVGAEIINYNLCAENGWQPDFEELEERHSRGEINLDAVKLMWCNYPNMPTGANGSIELFEKIVAFGKKYGIVVCHDNPYSFILNDNPVSIMEVEGAKEICIELNSMSKSHNMPGWRLGVLVSNSRFVEWVLRVKSNMDSGMFRPVQLAAVKALEAPKEWHLQMNSVYAARKALAQEILESVGAQVAPGQTGLFLWGKVAGKGVDVCDRVLYDAKVFITPGFIFGSNGENYVRISLCANEDTLRRALGRIKENVK